MEWLCVDSQNESKFTKVLTDISDLKQITLPVECPLCLNKSLHIYYHTFNNSKRGGIWIWCSICGSYSHYSGRPPDWWSNAREVVFSKLHSEPNYLDLMCTTLDRHFNSLYGAL